MGDFDARNPLSSDSWQEEMESKGLWLGFPWTSGFLCVRKEDGIQYKLRGWDSGSWVSVAENLRGLFWEQTVLTTLCWVVLVMVPCRNVSIFYCGKKKKKKVKQDTYTVQKELWMKGKEVPLCKKHDMSALNAPMVLVDNEAEERPKRLCRGPTGTSGSTKKWWDIKEHTVPRSITKYGKLYLASSFNKLCKLYIKDSLGGMCGQPWLSFLLGCLGRHRKPLPFPEGLLQGR